MNETVTDTLCGKTWTMFPDTEKTLKFNQDGTGEMICRIEYMMLIAAEFDWALLPAEGASTGAAQDGLLGQNFDLDLALTKRRLEKAGSQSLEGMKINEQMLKETAFEPKRFRISFEEGRFPVSYGERGTESAITGWYKRRLLFDTSPIPSVEHWREPGRAENFELWKHSDYYAERLPRAEDLQSAA